MNRFSVALVLTLIGFSAYAQTDQQVQFEIPPQPLSDALILFGDQSGRGVMADSVATETLESPGFSGDAIPEAALEQLLEGTGLTYRQDGDVFVIVLPGSAAGDTIGQRRPGIEEIIVTGQKREERIQDVPIAISAFSPEDLEAQKIEGGFDLLKGVPNVTFSKTNFSGYNFQIRGIGTQAVSATTDPGVAVSFNNTTLIVNRLFEQEYLDVERVEVLRGPQGTLFGRNATAGVINVITNKPELGVWDGMIDLETGNYSTERLSGFINVPIGDTLAIRGAYASTEREGYGINQAAGEPFASVSKDVDGRDLWTARFSLGWQPMDSLRMNLIWERFEEDDNRVRTSKQLCHRDTGVDIVNGVTGEIADASQYFYSALSKGCTAGSLYTDEAFGTPNGASLPYLSAVYWGPSYASGPLGGFAGAGLLEHGLGGNPFQGDPDVCSALAGSSALLPVDVCNPDVYRGRMQSRDLRTIYSLIEPIYQASADIIELSFDYEWTDNLLFSSQTVYADDKYYASQDYNRFRASPIWSDSAAACDLQGGFFGTTVNCSPSAIGTYADLNGDGVGFYRNLSPRPEGSTAPITGGGVLCDPQLGCSDSLVVQDLSRAESEQYNQEFRLVSSYPGDWNFSLGMNFTRFETLNDYFVFSNSLTHLLNFFPFQSADSGCVESSSPEAVEARVFDGNFCRFVDPTSLDGIIAGQGGDGHNYFRSANPYELTSSALFGELYWNATDTVKITLGLRFTWDRKVFTPVPSQLLLADYRDIGFINEGDGPEQCVERRTTCVLAGNAPDGRGSPPAPDIVQEWREPTGRLVMDWSPVLGFTDETMVYASFSHGYKGGGANPPSVAPPAKDFFDAASGGAPDTFDPEFINAYEIGTKNTLAGGALVLNGTAFYYDYSDYQVSKIFDRRAVNENFDAEVWGLEFESIFAPSLNWQFNAAIGYMDTKIANGEESIDLIDRTDGGNRHFAADPDAIGEGGGTTDFPEGFDEWIVIQPWITSASNCVVPRELMEANLLASSRNFINAYCPNGNVAGASTAALGSHYFDEDGNFVNGISGSPNFRRYDPAIDAPNGSAGFAKDLSGNELPNAPHWTVALGGQYNFDLTPDWRATARVDYYWQGESYARVYNLPEYDRLRSWSNTNLSFWATHAEWGVTVEGYVKNLFNETPITGAFLNSDDSGLTTNVFTLDPRLIGVSVRKEF